MHWQNYTMVVLAKKYWKCQSAIFPPRKLDRPSGEILKFHHHLSPVQDR